MKSLLSQRKLKNSNSTYLYYFSDKVKYFSTGVKWNERNTTYGRERIIQVMTFLNNQIRDYRLEFNEDPPVSFLTKKLKENGIGRRGGKNSASVEKQRVHNITLWEFFVEFYDYKENGFKKSSSMAPYKGLRRNLLDFGAEKQSVNDINDKWLKNFKKFLVEKNNHSVNTLSKRLSSLKMFFQYLDDQKNIKVGIKIDKVKSPLYYDNDNIVYLDKEELSKFYKYQFKEEKFNRIKDLFVFMCMTSLRYSDLITLRKGNISNDYFLNKVAIKSTERNKLKYQSYLNTTAIEIWSKYKDNGKEFPLSYFNHLQTFNNLLKEACLKTELFNEDFTIIRMVDDKEIPITKPKWNFITSKSGRKTFVTLAILNGVSLNNIMAATGHKQLQTLVHYMKFLERKNSNKEQFNNISI